VDSPLRAALQHDLGVAMRGRDASRVAVLRTTLAAIGNAEAVDASGPSVRTGLLGDVARRELTECDVRDIVATERDELLVAADEMRSLGQQAAASDCEQRAAVLEALLAS
jgi:hypothetical protein